MSNRRDFLKNVSMLTAGGLLAGNMESVRAAVPAVNVSTAQKVIGLQTYSLGGELAEDVPGGLKKVKAMGYSVLELAGYNNRDGGKIGKIEITEFKKMADDAGLKIVSSHMNPPARKYEQSNFAQISEFWKKTAEDHAKIGVKYIIQPGQPSTETHEEVKIVGEVFNDAGKIAKAAGLLFAYHNHNGEFKRIVKPEEKTERENPFAPKGDIIYDLMMAATDPSLVLFELDVYWTVMGQQDPVEYMQKYKDRIKVLHIKDRMVLGQSGMMNFEMIFKQMYANGIQDYFVELEGVKGMTQFEGVKGCAEYLMKAPFVK